MLVGSKDVLPPGVRTSHLPATPESKKGSPKGKFPFKTVVFKSGERAFSRFEGIDPLQHSGVVHILPYSLRVDRSFTKWRRSFPNASTVNYDSNVNCAQMLTTPQMSTSTIQMSTALVHTSPPRRYTPEVISQDVSIRWFSKVNSPANASTFSFN